MRSSVPMRASKHRFLLQRSGILNWNKLSHLFSCTHANLSALMTPNDSGRDPEMLRHEKRLTEKSTLSLQSMSDFEVGNVAQV